jgi:hypothetical protein
MTNPDNITNLSARLAELRAAMEPLGALLDRDDISEQDYQDAEARYASLFDRQCDLEDAVLAAPITAIADIAVKVEIIMARSMIFDDVSDLLETLHDRVKSFMRKSLAS